MRKYIYLICSFLIFPVSAAWAGDPAEGKVLYEFYCTQCHGIEGTGSGMNVADMAVVPRDHTDTGEMTARTDDELAKAIREGGKSVNKSVLMPAWRKNLSDEQISDLVAYLRQLCCQGN